MKKERLAIVNVVGLTGRLLQDTGNCPALSGFAAARQVRRIRPLVPAVTTTMQATYLTGLAPEGHGIVGNGWYDRTLAEHHFWKQSNHLVGGEKLWEAARRERGADFTCAKLFWWYNMYSSADISITPRPIYCADGRKVFDIYADPPEVREAIKADLGDFPFPSFWGPRAGIPSSRWIADAARWTEERRSPDLSLVYLPHLDYDLQRRGTAGAATALREIDAVVGDLLAFYQSRGVEVVLLSEYGITDVDRPVHLNRLFRERDWFRVRDELGLEVPDLGASQAFAIADHQVAHVYVKDPSIVPEVRGLLERVPGVGEIQTLGHPRAGDLVVVADARSWFTYYYWLDDARAPDYARCVDIHRKIGYDPVELFVDPAIRAPALRVAGKLARKALGFRMLMDLIPLDASLVRGSHGRVPESEDDWPVLVGDFPPGGSLDATDVFGALMGRIVRP